MNLTLKEFTEWLGQLSCKLIQCGKYSNRNLCKIHRKMELRDGQSGDGIDVKRCLKAF